MWKKAVPAVAMCSLLLVGCNNNKTAPNNNETPMQDVRQGVDKVNPNVNPNLTTPENYTPTPGINNNGTDVNRGVNGNNRIDNVGPTGNEVVPDGNMNGTNGTTGGTMGGTTGTNGTGVKGQTK